MDYDGANQLAGELGGVEVGGWEIGPLVGSGKSAVVLKARKGECDAVIKVFDPGLIRRFGRNIQLERIQRECTLIGARHENLVQILDGGECPETEHLFVVMDDVRAPNLADALPDVPTSMFRTIVRQVAAAARFLETRSLAHRDIKPSNVAVAIERESAILLDLGVLRPLGGSDITDADSREFVGTLRYSSPEFLFRTEEQTAEGWRALTFYQIGALLYDLLAGRPLFNEFSQPYARLVDAVKYERPDTDIAGADPDLCQLAACCLIKDPSRRLELVNWASFEEPQPHSLGGLRARVRRLQATAGPAQGERAQPEWAADAREIAEFLQSDVRSECVQNRNIFPPVEIQERQETNGECVVDVIFPADPTRQLVHALFVRYRVAILSPVDRDCRVSQSAYLVEGVRDQPTEEVGAPAIVFEGPFVREAMGTRIVEGLYVALEGALAREPLGPIALRIEGGRV